MKYFRRKWDERRGDQYDTWGTCLILLETDISGFPSRKIEKYDNGVVLKYSRENSEDKFGMLGDQSLDLEEFSEFEIPRTDFESEWELKGKRFITSETLGTLFQNDQFDDWWESDPIEIGLLDNKKLTFTIMDMLPDRDQNFIQNADEAVKSFLEKKTNYRMDLSQLAYQNCMDFLNAVEYDEADSRLWNIKDKSEIWNFIYPQEIYIRRRYRRDKDIYITLACECEWEQEHGLQLVFRKGEKLTRISIQDGHLTEADAFDKLDTEDVLLSQFNDKKEKLPTKEESKGRKSDNMNKDKDNTRWSWWRRLWS